MLTQPYWQMPGVARQLPHLLPQPPPALPSRVDVLVVGAGYTGLAAAEVTSAAGAITAVIEAGPIGAGCSGRNGGQVAYSIKPKFENLAARYGAVRAGAICREGMEAMHHLRTLAIEPGSECGWRHNGCFVGAHTRRAFAVLAREAEQQPPGLEQRVSVVTKADQHREIDSDFYHGGVVYHDDASVDPMRLLQELLRRAMASGAAVFEHRSALAIRPVRGGYEVMTADGPITAAKVLIATNGYSGPWSTWHRRRVIPIGSYQIATEPLGVERVRALIPQARNIVDSRRVVVYFRPSPDGERIIFGGRAALAESDPRVCAPRLRDMLVQVFPQLRTAAIAHAWVGWVAYTFDQLPHLGRHDGVYYCMGYCGQGVPLAPYYGRRIGQQMVGLHEGATALDGLPFGSRPYYFGTPWFLAPSVLTFRALDRLGI